MIVPAAAEAVWGETHASADKRRAFEARLELHWQRLFALLYRLYSQRYDFFFHLEQILLAAARAWARARPWPLSPSCDRG